MDTVILGEQQVMPRKVVKGKTVNAVGIEMKAVRLELTPEIHKELRIEAAKEEKSMAALVRDLVEAHLANKRKAAK